MDKKNPIISALLMKGLSFFRNSIVVGLVFFVVTTGVFGVYAARTLQGDINNFILASELFGVPADIRAHGVKPLYQAPETGWDGQFYYYMSNDLLGIKDTAQYIDTPSYRYQRIGLSLYAAIIAKLTAKEWVSPVVFFVSYLALITAATMVGGQLISRLGGPPILILLWSFSVGTQLTLFNGLPDAAADAFLIFALAALFSQRIVLSVLAFIFAALSREVYSIFPSAILFFTILAPLRGGGGKVTLLAQVLGCLRRSNCWLLLLPGLVTVGWNIYVTLHFGVSPSAQANGILGFPFVAWKDSYLTALRSGVSEGQFNFLGDESVCLILFLAVLVVAFCVAIQGLLSRTGLLCQELRGIAASTLLFVVLYASFGPTVTGHYTGYFKAVSVFFFLVPLILLARCGGSKWKGLWYGLLLFILIYTGYVNLQQRILLPYSGDDRYTRMSTLTRDSLNNPQFLGGLSWK